MYRKLFYNSNCILNTETNVVVFDFNKEWSDYLDWVVDNPELEKKIENTKGWVEVHPGYLQYGLDTWVGSPIELNKFLLVSWRMGGSEFCKELIRENYPETTPINHWAKSHIILDDELSAKSWMLARNIRVLKSIPENHDVRALLAVQQKDALVIAQAQREGELDFLLLPKVHE